jgi:hypothetical protein
MKYNLIFGGIPENRDDENTEEVFTRGGSRISN